jgi:DNA-binding transcriptional MerR regulator
MTGRASEAAERGHADLAHADRAQPDITEVARRTGLPASTLRFYEQKGLIASIGRRGQRRVFDAGVVQRLALIGIARSGGFSLDEIRRLLDPVAVLDRNMLRAKADELDVLIGTLTGMRDDLRHAADCPAPSYPECPTFRRVMSEAASGAGRVGFESVRSDGGRRPGGLSTR